MRISTEDFFMYLTIALIVIIPVSVRLLRYLRKDRTAKMLQEQFGDGAGQKGTRDNAP